MKRKIKYKFAIKSTAELDRLSHEELLKYVKVTVPNPTYSIIRYFKAKKTHLKLSLIGCDF